MPRRRIGARIFSICIFTMVSIPTHPPPVNRVWISNICVRRVSSHADFWAYGVFDLVDKTLSLLNTKIKKKDWQGAFVVLEALMLFVECEGIWTRK